MMTLKHSEPTGHEVVFQVKRVTYHAAFTNNPQSVFYELPEGDGYFINSGTVYLMNDHGKTVAVYRLGGEGIPVDSQGVGLAFGKLASGEGRDPRVQA